MHVKKSVTCFIRKHPTMSNEHGPMHLRTLSTSLNNSICGQEFLNIISTNLKYRIHIGLFNEQNYRIVFITLKHMINM